MEGILGVKITKWEENKCVIDTNESGSILQTYEDINET
jgi:hypothetical protein